MTFYSKGEAKKYLSHINNNKTRKKPVKGMYPYYCNDCSKWHLTSQSKARTRRSKRYQHKMSRQHNLIIEFKNLTSNNDRWAWLAENNADWMKLFIGERTYITFNDKYRVIFD